MKRIRVLMAGCFLVGLVYFPTHAAPILIDDFNAYASGAQTKNDAIWESWYNAWAWDGQGNKVSSYGSTDYTAYFPFDNALFFTGTGQRSASTVNIDLSLGGWLSFNLSLGSANPRYDGPFERQDGNERVVLEYSLNSGTNWLTIVTFDINDSGYTNANRWSLFQYEIEAGTPVASNLVAFRLRQLTHSGSQFDTWAFDNFQVTSSATPIPEPGTLLLLGTGLISLAAIRKRPKMNG